MFGEARRGGSTRGVTHSNSQHSSRCQRILGTLKQRQVFSARGFPNAERRRGCHVPANRSSVHTPAQALPGRRPLCGRGPGRRKWPFAGDLAVRGFARRTADQCSGRSEPAGGERVHSPAEPGSKCCSDVAAAYEKNCRQGRNHTATAALTIRRRAKPPSPSPSITRRRTPVAFSGRGSILALASALFPGSDLRFLAASPEWSG
jgi:hypothetical protein